MHRNRASYPLNESFVDTYNQHRIAAGVLSVDMGNTDSHPSLASEPVGGTQTSHYLPASFTGLFTAIPCRKVGKLILKQMHIVHCLCQCVIFLILTKSSSQKQETITGKFD